MNPWLYAAVCVIVPLVWGLMVDWASHLVERRLGIVKDADQTIAQDDKV